MSSHSLAEAQTNLSELLDRAERGEEVVIVREGRPAVALRPAVRQSVLTPDPHVVRTVDPEKLAWIRSVRVKPEKPFSQSGADLVRQMRDEDDM